MATEVAKGAELPGENSMGATISVFGNAGPPAEICSVSMSICAVEHS
jgi:hypothetical protein